MNITRRAVTVLTVAVAALATASGAAAGSTPSAPLAGHAPLAAGLPAGFQPAAASFWSAARGVVLGGVRCKEGEPCLARLATTGDSGLHWHFLPSPDVWIANHRPLVAHVVFANRRDGWLYGPGGRRLWATHDGGAHWRALSIPGNGIIQTMAASHGMVYALAGRNSRPSNLFKSPASRNSWSRVGQMTGGVLAVFGPAVWLGSSTHLWVTTDSVRWHKYPFRCPNDKYGDPTGLGSIAAASRSRVAFLCLGQSAAGSESKVLARSVNSGRTTHLAGYPPLGGSGGVIAVPPHHPMVIALGSAFLLSRSADGGKIWVRKFFEGGGAPWNYLAYSSAMVGWAEFGTPPISGLLKTTNAGRTWFKVRF
jgi:photosystem II stability/assembly factor-like uncharacterized protein